MCSLPSLSGGVSFGVKQGSCASAFDAAKKLTDNLTIVSILANVGDVKSLIIHPASTTHEQLEAEEQAAAGVAGDMLRLSVGYEDIEDLKRDFSAAFAAMNA